jgi:TolA-binding protein
MIEEMEKFIKQYPKSPLMMEALVELGDLYLLLKDYPKALERFERAIQDFPQHPLMKRVYLGMEEGYRSLGKTDQAEKVLKELLVNFPNDDIRFEAHLRLGLLSLTKKRLKDAITNLSLALRSPEEEVASQAQFKLGEAYLEAEDKELALLQFSKVVYLYPHRSEVMEEALLKLGSLYMEENRISEARQAYQKLLEKTRREDRREMARRMLDQLHKGILR